MANSIRFFLIVFAAIFATTTMAQDIAQPKGQVVLTISGDLQVTNVDGTAQFDLEQLKALPQITFTTTTIWNEGENEYSGPTLQSLLEAVGVQQGTASAVAINDYAVDIPIDSLSQDAPIVALEMNGAPMSVRDKGPLWVIYPYDAAPRYRSEVIYSRSIWQLDRIVAK